MKLMIAVFSLHVNIAILFSLELLCESWSRIYFHVKYNILICKIKFFYVTLLYMNLLKLL